MCARRVQMWFEERNITEIRQANSLYYQFSLCSQFSDSLMCNDCNHLFAHFFFFFFCSLLVDWSTIPISRHSINVSVLWWAPPTSNHIIVRVSFDKCNIIILFLYYFISFWYFFMMWFVVVCVLLVEGEGENNSAQFPSASRIYDCWRVGVSVRLLHITL